MVSSQKETAVVIATAVRASQMFSKGDTMANVTSVDDKPQPTPDEKLFKFQAFKSARVIIIPVCVVGLLCSLYILYFYFKYGLWSLPFVGQLYIASAFYCAPMFAWAVWQEFYILEIKVKHKETELKRLADEYLKSKAPPKRKPIPKPKPIDMHKQEHIDWVNRIPAMPIGEYVYIIQDITLTGWYKIGHTNNPMKRLVRFEVTLPINLNVVHIITCEDRRQLERLLHHKYADKRQRGEWFALSANDVEYLKVTYRSES